VTWTVAFFDTDVEERILGLPPGLLARFVRMAELMELHGPNLGMPHSRAMGAGLCELRLRSREGIARIFYCVSEGRRIVVLHHFIKKSQRTPIIELEIARKRMRGVANG